MDRSRDGLRFKPVHETFKLVVFCLAIGMMYPNPNNETRRLIYLGSIMSSAFPLLVTFCRELCLCAINREIEIFTEQIAMFIPVIFIFIKWSQTAYLRKDMQRILDQINKDYEKCNQKCEEFQDMVVQEITKTKTLLKICITTITSSSLVFIVIPILLMTYYSIFDEPKFFLIHDMRVWGLTEEKKFQSPYFHFLFAYELYIMVVIWQVYVGYAGMFLISVSHLCLKLKICQYNMLKALSGANNLCKIRRNIGNVVNEQCETFEFLALIEKKFQLWLGSSFVLFVIQTSLNLYQAVSKQGKVDPRFMVFGVALVFYIFLPCYISTKVTVAAMEVAQSAYYCGWELVPDTGIRRSLCIIIARAQVPLEITAFKILTFNMELFVSILKTSYSILTILRK